MKKIKFFSLFLTALMACGTAWAQDPALKFDATVTSNSTVRFTVDEHFEYSLLMPNPSSCQVDPTQVTVNVKMYNVASLGIQGTREAESTISTGVSHGLVDLSSWLGNVYSFDGATMPIEVLSNGQTFPCQYNIAAYHPYLDKVVGTPDDEEDMRTAWWEITSHVTPSQQATDDSYLTLKAGSYLLMGDERLTILKDFDFFKGQWTFANLIAAFVSAEYTDVRTVSLTDQETYKTEIFFEKGCVLAQGQTLATLDDPCTVSFDCTAAYQQGVSPRKEGILSGMMNDINNEPTQAGKTYVLMVDVMKMLNDIIGQVDAANNVPAVVAFEKRPVIVVESEVSETPENKDVLGQLTAGNAGVDALTEEESNLLNATSGYEADKEKHIIVVLTDITIAAEVKGYTANLKSTTYDVTPKYKDENGDMQVIPNEEITDSITFRLPIIKEYAGINVNIYHQADAQAEQDFVGEFAVQNEDTSYYVELKAKEFSLYKVTAAGYEYNRTTKVDMIGTICLPYDIDVANGNASGAQFFELNYRNNAVVSQVTEVTGEEITTTLEGGKAYLFKATGTNVHCEWTPVDVAKPAATDQPMVGNLDDDPIKPASLKSATVAPYVVDSLGVIRPCGPNAYVSKNRAYINMEAVPSTPPTPAPGRRIIRLTANGANIVTDIENVNANVNRKMMVDGQLVIIRDGKMFNAQGQEL